MSGCSRSDVATGRHLVVVASTDPSGTDALAERLRDAVAVRTAYDVEEVLNRLDREVDAVLVDPTLADGAVETVQNAGTGSELECLVALLTDVPPDGTDADAVVSPSVPDSTLRRDVLDLAIQARYRKTLEEYYDVACTAARTNETEADPNRLQTRLDALTRRLEDTAEPMDPATLFRTVLDDDGRDADREHD